MENDVNYFSWYKTDMDSYNVKVVYSKALSYIQTTISR